MMNLRIEYINVASLSHGKWLKLLPLVRQASAHSTLVSSFGCIVGIYLAPSLSLHTIRRQLSEIPTCVCLIGDVNAKFGRPFGQDYSGPRERVDLLNTFARRRSLTHIVQQTRLDHVW